ncbi:Lrp/AsnC family transcriptional regulator, partial [Streptomyces scabiei]|uniref:Lrp/AsnC family transcriptional regulator n=1 Tax=Streptomyces scabiei TaxID=1930 RepID=UPI0038F7F335
MSAAAELDATDRALLRHLQADGRRSWTDLARDVGLTAPAVRQRVQRLIDSGVVQIAAVT